MIPAIGYGGYNGWTDYPGAAAGAPYARTEFGGEETAKSRGMYGIAGAEKPDPGAKPGFKSSPENCETCRERKYQDGSDENVSFKAAAHISPEAAASRVRAHEGEHVANAYSKAAEKGGKVLNASVSIHTAICPECGRTYVSGGTTNTLIKYPNESNPYQQNKKAVDAIGLRGNNVDIAV